MDRKKELQPGSHGELRDPKLPVVHGTDGGNAALQQIHSAPIPQPSKEL